MRWVPKAAPVNENRDEPHDTRFICAHVDLNDFHMTQRTTHPNFDSMNPFQDAARDAFGVNLCHQTPQRVWFETGLVASRLFVESDGADSPTDCARIGQLGLSSGNRMGL